MKQHLSFQFGHGRGKGLWFWPLFRGRGTKPDTKPGEYGQVGAVS